MGARKARLAYSRSKGVPIASRTDPILPVSCPLERKWIVMGAPEMPGRVTATELKRRLGPI